MPFWRKESTVDPSQYMPPPAAQKEAEPPPTYVSEAKFNDALTQVQALNAKLDHMTTLFTGTFSGQQPQQQPVQQQAQQLPNIQDITDAEYEEALLKGDAKQVAVRMNAVTERAVRAQNTQWESRFNALEQQGMGLLNQVTGEMTQTALNTMPYYQLFRTEIDDALKVIPSHQHSPAMRKMIYDSVVGSNVEKVIAHNATEATRQAQQRQETTTPGRTQHQQGPTPESVFGSDIMQPNATWRGGASLWAKRTPDQWAQSRFGVANLQEAAVFATNIMAIDDCRQCFTPIIQGKCHCH